MDLLHKKVLYRTFGFLLLWSLSSFLFVLVEHTEEKDFEVKSKLLRSMFDSMASKYNMTLEDFNHFSNMAYEALSEPKMEWTYTVAMRFVFQAVTTIGYGFITPQTPEGQLLCIFVSLLGIPITVLAFQAIGELISRWVNKVVQKIEKKILKREETKRMRKKSVALLVSLTLILIIVNGFVMMIPFDWSFIEAVYFWIVTLTTIGFGDYAPVKSQRIEKLSINISQSPLKEEGLDAVAERTHTLFTSIFYSLYLVLCLCLVSSILNSILSYIEERKFRAPCPGCVPKKIQAGTENELNISTDYRPSDFSISKVQGTGNITPLSIAELR